MSLIRVLWHGCVCFAAGAGTVAAAEPPRDARQSSPTIAFDGLIQLQADWVSPLEPQDEDTGIGIARAEFGLKGTIGTRTDWTVVYEARNRQWLDVNLQVKGGRDDRHRLLLGQFKQFNVPEALESTRTRAFVDSTAVGDAFALSRRLGVGYQYDRGDWQVSVARFHRDLDRMIASANGAVARATWAPWQGRDGLLQIGLSHARLARASTSLATDQASDAPIAAGLQHSPVRITGAEAMWLHRSLRVQADWLQADARAVQAGSLPRGYSTSLVWNLTGERWTLDAGLAETPDPGHPSGGLWQLGMRHARLIQPHDQREWAIALTHAWSDHWKLVLQQGYVRERDSDGERSGRNTHLLLQLHW